MKSLARGPLVPVILIVATILFLVLHEVGYLQGVEDLVLRLVTPVQRWFSARALGVSDSVRTVRDLTTLLEENARLRRENEALTIENVQLREAESENRRLRQLLGFARDNPAYDYRGAEVIARVIGRDPNIYLDYIIIDQGRKGGIRAGMPVTTERGLVGRVTQVHETSSEVLLITDVNSSVTALTQSARAMGVVRGTAGGGLLMDQVAQDAQVNEGDIVLTSGLGGNFPKGLVIGQVIQVQQRDHDMFQQAVVRPSVSFRYLEQVVVITNFVPLAEQQRVPEGTQ